MTTQLSMAMATFPSMPIEHQILQFLKDLIANDNFDFIIPVERKGTAVCRVLIQEMADTRLDWPWQKVLSSIAIDFIDSHVLEENEFYFLTTWYITGIIFSVL